MVKQICANMWFELASYTVQNPEKVSIYIGIPILLLVLLFYYYIKGPLFSIMSMLPHN